VVHLLPLDVTTSGPALAAERMFIGVAPGTPRCSAGTPELQQILEQRRRTVEEGGRHAPIVCRDLQKSSTSGNHWGKVPSTKAVAPLALPVPRLPLETICDIDGERSSSRQADDATTPQASHESPTSPKASDEIASQSSDESSQTSDEEGEMDQALTRETSLWTADDGCPHRGDTDDPELDDKVQGFNISSCATTPRSMVSSQPSFPFGVIPQLQMNQVNPGPPGQELTTRASKQQVEALQYGKPTQCTQVLAHAERARRWLMGFQSIAETVDSVSQAAAKRSPKIATEVVEAASHWVLDELHNSFVAVETFAKPELLLS